MSKYFKYVENYTNILEMYATNYYTTRINYNLEYLKFFWIQIKIDTGDSSRSYPQVKILLTCPFFWWLRWRFLGLCCSYLLLKVFQFTLLNIDSLLNPIFFKVFIILAIVFSYALSLSHDRNAVKWSLGFQVTCFIRRHGPLINLQRSMIAMETAIQKMLQVNRSRKFLIT